MQTDKDIEDVQIWPFVKAYCNACRQIYWFKDARPIDVALNRIDCGCGCKAVPKAVFCYNKKEIGESDA